MPINMKYIIGILAVAVAVMGWLAFKSVNIANINIPDIQVGAMPSPDVITPLRIHNTFMWGGKTLATTTGTVSATTTLSGSNLADYNLIDVLNMRTTKTGPSANFAYKLPGTTTMISLLPDIGMTREWVFHNSTSSAVTLGIEVPTGIDLVALTSANDYADAGEWMELICTRIYYRDADNENIMCIVSELLNSD